jgi:hypothetical protein
MQEQLASTIGSSREELIEYADTLLKVNGSTQKFNQLSA